MVKKTNKKKTLKPPKLPKGLKTSTGRPVRLYKSQKTASSLYGTGAKEYAQKVTKYQNANYKKKNLPYTLKTASFKSIVDGKMRTVWYHIAYKKKK